MSVPGGQHEPATSPRFTPAGPRWRTRAGDASGAIRARPGGRADPYRIPIPLTGPYQEEALDMLRGGHVAVAMFNAQGHSAARRPNL